MATDVEESDTDERPGPAKKQRVVPAQSTSNSNNPVEINQQPQEPENSTNVIDEEEADRRSREKLLSWQACQVAKAFIDNIINRVLENYIVSPPASYPFEDPWYSVLRGNQMEDTAITMAIRNHGVVRTLDLSESTALLPERLDNVPQNSDGAQSSLTTISSQLADSEVASTSGEGNWLDDTYDSDHQQDFLDRAVAEAIKKKGLSTLSVDYG